MKRFSAQFIFTVSGQPLKRGIITTDDNGTILDVEDTEGETTESAGIEFYNGIIVPGFINCHCHLELSHLKDFIGPSKGLGEFIMQVRNSRGNIPEARIFSEASTEDENMYREGIVLCADICNSSDTFGIKKNSRIQYLNLLEVFGIDPAKADKRLSEVLKLSEDADRNGLEWTIVPHSAYSVSLPLFRKLKEKTIKNRVTSVHFMECRDESVFLSDQSGPLKTSYESSGLMPANVQMVEDHITAILDEITRSGNLILVHNTYTDLVTIKKVMKRGNVFWCLCPGSNLHIENNWPPVDLLRSEGCDITTGTDSLASNNKLSILGEMIKLQEHFPSIPLEELAQWATINGARALGKDEIFGTIEPGKKPGLVLLENIDLINLKLRHETTARRLI